MDDVGCRILIADDEVTIRQGLQEALQQPGHVTDTASDGNEALDQLNRRSYDVVVLDLRMPGPGGMEILDEIHETHPQTQTIILTAHGNVLTAVEAMKRGAFDFVTKPVDLTHLRLVVGRARDRVDLEKENRELHSRLDSRQETDDAFRRIVRRSAAMQKATRTVKQVAMSDVPVLLRGETGAGKELVAHAIHERSKRREGPFVAVNCGGFTEDLFSSELFGHKRGAFTGAHADRPGRFALAEEGTLFLDEIGEVPLKNQIELLRVLESKEYQPLGEPAVHTADVRIIAATNRDLEAAVSEGIFRDDLYYRLNVIPLDVPPLRDRREDIPLLVETFLEASCRAYDQPRKKFTREAMAQLVGYDWPGNVRELRNLIQRLVVTCPGRALSPEHLADALGEPPPDADAVALHIPLGSSLRDVEAEFIQQTLQRVTSNRRKAADILGISVRALQYKLKKYDIK